MTAWRYASLPQRREARAVLMDRQGGRCAGCFDLGLTLQVDHDHDTGWIRGLLCAPCNVGEGRGQALAWDLYIAETPAALVDAEAVRASFVRRCQEAERRAVAAIQRGWQYDFRYLAEKAMRRKLDEFEQWRWADPKPANPEFEEWLAWLADMQARVSTAVGRAVTIDPEPLAEFGIKRWEAESMARDIALDIASRLDRKDTRRRQELMQEQMATRLPPHLHVFGEAVWNERARRYNQPCAFPDCGIEAEDHPLDGFREGELYAHVDRLRSVAADLAGSEEAAA